MNTITTSIVTVIIFVLLLNSGLTPWRIVKQEQISELTQQAEQGRQMVEASQSTAAAHRKPFFDDPDYKTPLEKKATSGTPDKVKSH